MSTNTPVIETKLRHNIVHIPEEARRASGIVLLGRRIKTLIFTTDLAIIRNCDADAVLAVYPFTPQLAISDAIIKYSYIPVFCGIGGGTTHGLRTISIAKEMESAGAVGVVMNSPITNLNLRAVSRAVDIPVTVTVTSKNTDIQARLDAGATILNVACGQETPEVVHMIRTSHPDTPIIATGGKTSASIRETIEAGANAISYTPPTTAELFHTMMDQYREEGNSVL